MKKYTKIIKVWNMDKDQWELVTLNDLKPIIQIGG